MRSCLLSLLAIAMIGLWSGCGADSSGPTTYPVTGTVTLDGTPLETGSIVFDPLDGAGQGCASDIKAGKFDMDACEGNMKVSITSTKNTGKLDEYGEPIFESFLPPNKYDINSKITVQVTADGENSFTFDLTSDPKRD